MNLALRDIRHSLGRFLLTCLGVGLLLGVVLSMIGIFRGLVDDALVLVRSAGADLWVVESGSRGPFAESSRLPADTRDAVARLAGVAEAGAVTYQTVEAVVGDRAVRLTVIGSEIGRLGGARWITEGRPLARAHFELVADRRTGLRPGDRLRLGRNSFTVVGLTEGQVDSGGNAVVHMTLADAQTLQFELAAGAAARNLAARGLSESTHTVNAIVARLHPGVDGAGVVAAVTRWKHLSALTQDEQEQILLTAVVDKARKQIGLFTAVLLAVSTVVIGLIIYTMTMDKVREIATLKLIGAPDRTIVALIVQQALAMGLIGFAMGAGTITAVADRFPRRVLLLPEDALALAAVVVMACLLASLLGVRLALRIDPAQALGG